MVTRRGFLSLAQGAALAALLPGCGAPRLGGRSAARVVVVGGGYGGATAAKYLKLWAPQLEVVLIERENRFVSCPLSNLVVAGNAAIEDITLGYGALAQRGVRVVRDDATAIDAERRQVRLSSGAAIAYDRVVISPGVDYLYDELPGLRTADARQRVLHAWQAGDQTLALKRQLETMRDGGVFVIHIPLAPFRCPPGPYERVCQVADYFKRAKPRSKIIVLDANADLVSKRNLFLGAWEHFFKGMIDYQPNSELLDVDAKTLTLKLQFDDVQGDVVNVIPPQRAGEIAQRSGLLASAQHWCAVDWLTCESAVPGVHVLGDATLAANAMPKSATMANQHAKLCAAATIALLNGEAPDPAPMIANTCYSFLTAKTAVHVASVHQYDAVQKTLVPVKGAGGLSEAPSEAEAAFGWAWARNIWSDAFA